MDNINQGELLKLMDRVRQLAGFRQIFARFSDKYSKKFVFEEQDKIISRVKKINAKIETQVEGEQQGEDVSQKIESFQFGELKVFTWVIVALCASHDLALQGLNRPHFQYLQSIFARKSISFVTYEVFSLSKEKLKVKKVQQWTAEEVNKFSEIVRKKKNVKEWRQISYELFLASEGRYYRSYQECREKWFNHLDPKIKKGNWTLQEDHKLLTEAEAYSCNWSQIFQQMGGERTQHMIKNRYKSLYNYYKKQTNEKSQKRILVKALKIIQRKMEEAEAGCLLSGLPQSVQEYESKAEALAESMSEVVPESICEPQISSHFDNPSSEKAKSVPETQCREHEQEEKIPNSRVLQQMQFNQSLSCFPCYEDEKYLTEMYNRCDAYDGDCCDEEDQRLTGEDQIESLVPFYLPPISEQKGGDHQQIRMIPDEEYKLGCGTLQWFSEFSEWQAEKKVSRFYENDSPLSFLD